MARLAIWVLLLAGGVGLVQANYLQLKAVVAQHLIAQSWNTLQQSSDASSTKPWGWADFSPVASLSWQSHEVFVMSSTSGQALAFGPGHLPSSARPGTQGRVIIAGHNDSHFAFLEQLQSGDELSLENAHGTKKAYKITSIDIVDSNHNKLLNSGQDELLLVTCYPFRSLLPDTPLRLVVSARVIEGSHHRKTT